MKKPISRIPKLQKSANSPEERAAEKFCRETVDKILLAHGLTDFIVSVRTSHGRSTHDTHTQMTVAEMDVDTEYLRATMVLYPKFVEFHNEGMLDDLRRIICHEMAHLRTATLASMATDRYVMKEVLDAEVERLTEIMGRCMYRAMSFKE